LGRLNETAGERWELRRSGRFHFAHVNRIYVKAQTAMVLREDSVFQLLHAPACKDTEEPSAYEQKDHHDGGRNTSDAEIRPAMNTLERFHIRRADIL